MLYSFLVALPIFSIFAIMAVIVWLESSGSKDPKDKETRKRDKARHNGQQCVSH